jgi:hypothetical protein
MSSRYDIGIINSEIYMVGVTMGDFGEMSSGGADIFVSQFDDTGVAKQTQQFGTNGYDQPRYY